MRRPQSRWVPSLLLLACQPAIGLEPPPEDPAPRPAVDAPAAPIAPESPYDRRCGQAGETPTELPPALVIGRTPAGEGMVRPGEALTLGTIRVQYDTDAWIGTMRAGSRGPALSLLIDQAEAGGGPWGAQVELQHGLTERSRFVGPYEFVLRGAGKPPAEVSVRVTREACPGAVEIAKSDAPRSLWVSSDAIRQHTYDLHGALLQVILDTNGEAPRLDITRLGFRHSYEPRPDVTRSFRVGASLVTVDRVVPGAGTRFEGGRWIADDRLHAHVRARIEPAPPPLVPPPVPAVDPCGAPNLARTALPTALTALPAAAAHRTLELGQDAKFGPLSLEYRTFEIPAYGGGPYRKEAQQIPNLLVVDVPPNSVSLAGPYNPPRLARLGREILRVDPAPGGAPERIAVQRFTVACPREIAVPRVEAATYLWLSTYGHTTATVGTPGPEGLTLQIYADTLEPGLGMLDGRASFSRIVGLDLPGQAFTLDHYLVEIVDVVTSGDTRFEGNRWQTSAGVPGVHVQLRVSPV